MLASSILRATSRSVRQFHHTTSLNGSCSTKINNTFVKTLTRGARTRAGVRTWEATRKPSTLTAENVGRGVLGGACAVGVGGLCFYGLGLSNEAGAIDKARFWPEEVRQRIKSTYMYFVSTLGLTAGAAYYVSRSQFIYRMMGASPWLVFGGGMIAMIGSSMACRAIEYSPGLNAKHVAWAVHSGVVGCVIAPLLLLGGPLVARAACYTGATVAALSLTAACAPDKKFLTWAGPLSLGLGGVFIASIGGMFVGPASAAAPVIHSIVTYGGLVVFGGFMLYDTQKIIHKAQMTRYDGTRYDPINASMGIYMDTVNIFIRILMILSGNRRK